MFAGTLQAFVDLISSPIDIGAILERDGHGAEPESADRTYFVDIRNTAHRIFDGKGDELFDFFGA